MIVTVPTVFRIKKIYIVFLITAIFAIAVSQPVNADSNRSLALAQVAATYGPQVAKQIRKQTGYEMPTSSLPPSQRSVAVDETYREYTRIRSQYASVTNSTSWISLGTSGGAAVVAAVAGPQAAITVPIILTAAAITTIIEVGNAELENHGAERLRTYLRANEDRIVEELGMTFEQMRANPDEAAKRIESSAEVFEDLRNRSGNDPAVWRQSQELITRTLMETDRAQWEEIGDVRDQVEQATKDVAQLSVDLSTFKKAVDTRFTNLEIAFEDMGVRVDLLQDAVVRVDVRVSKLEVNQAVISDFVLDSMSPAQKVAAIRDRGFLAERFACADGTTDCEAAKLKDDLIDRFTHEAELQSALAYANKAIGTLNDIGKIASDLGIDSPELSLAVSIGNSAMGAFASFSKGNYIGAIASVTGLFAKKKDPDAERFKILMGYLQEQFAIVNAKLDLVLKNQEALMERIDVLGQVMNDGFRSIDRQLANLAFEQARIDLGVRQLLWAPWKTCYTVYDGVLDASAGPSLVDPVTLLIRDETALREIQLLLGNAALDCLPTMQGALAATRATERFGQFVSVDWAINEGLSQAGDVGRAACVGEFDDEGEYQPEWRSLMFCFREDIFDPAIQTLKRAIIDDGDLDFAKAYLMLARPMTTTDDWTAGYGAAKNLEVACPVRVGSSARLAQILCPVGSNDPSARALELLQTPILADAVNDVADWVMVMSQLVDVRDQFDDRWLSYSDLLAKAEAGGLSGRRPLGQWMIERSISVVDIAIANYAMVYGPVLAEQLTKDITTGGSMGEMALRIASSNPYAARNLSQLWLEKRYQITLGHQQRQRPARTAYAAALEMAETDSPGRYLFLEGIFGPDTKFVEMKSGQIGFRLTVGQETLDLALPGVGAMVEGRVHWPSRYHELIATRDQLVDRLAAYTVLDGLDDDALMYMTAVITEPQGK